MEAQFTEETEVTAPPPQERKTKREKKDEPKVDPPEDAAGKASDEEESREEAVAPPDRARDRGPKLHVETRKIVDAENKALAEIIGEFGPEGHWRCKVKRAAPTEVRHPVTGQIVQTSGYLTTLTEAFDEDVIKRRWGGGKYHLEFTKRTDKGKYDYAGNKTVIIAGDPDLNELPKSVAPLATVSAPAATSGSESPTVVNKALEMMGQSMLRAEERADRALQAPRETHRGPDPAIENAMAMMRDTIAELRQDLAHSRQQLADLTAKAREPIRDPVKDSLLEKLMVDDTARLHAVRTTYDSEIRQLKDGHAQEMRIRDERHERELERARQQHAAEVQRLQQGFERELAAARQSHEIQMAAMKGSHETTTKLNDSENNRLNRELSELRVEVKELREKKDKPLIEQVKEIKTLKEMLGHDEDEDDDKEESALDKVVGAVTNPQILEAVGGFFDKRKQAAQQQPAQPAKPQVMEGPDGQKFILENGRIRPVKIDKKKRLQIPAVPATGEQAAQQEGAPPEQQQVVQQEALPEAELPDIPEEDLDRLIMFLEAAFGAGTSPETVAQGLRPRIPNEALVYLRDRMAELGTARGVDLFFAKVAKLPSTSTLANQLGRNWSRDVAKALVGMDS